jgi:hypothetical protein
MEHLMQTHDTKNLKKTCFSFFKKVKNEVIVKNYYVVHSNHLNRLKD